MTEPKLTKEEALKYLEPFDVDQGGPVILGIRGYYLHTMGKPDQNDRGIYDDAHFIISPDLFKPFNANTDPSITRKGVAILQPGVYWYIKGLHGISHLDNTNKEHMRILKQLIDTRKDVQGWVRTYWALRQDSDVVVKRDGHDQLFKDDIKNRFWIDIHRGSFNSTSSLGCQTIYPDQWESYRNTAYTLMDKYNVKKIPYALVDFE